MLLILLQCVAASLLAVDVAAIAINSAVRRSVEGQSPSGDLVGAGYSSDTQQVTSQKCYNATVSYVSEQKANVELGTALTFTTLESKLGVSVSASGGYAMFAASAEADYMRSIQDTDYSFSLNYYHYGTNTVAVQIGGYGKEALSESGRGFYNDGKNPLFGLSCGDHYIDSYQQGFLLTMGLNIKFSSSDEKTAFNVKTGASYGSIVSAALSVSSVSNKNNITGSVTIQAFQKGGEPSQLSNILRSDGSGKYYALGCSITAMEDCVQAASGLLDYAKNYLPNQVSFKNNIGLTPLGIRFSNFRSIDYLGLIPPPTQVTQEVEQSRNELATKLKESKYYQQKFHTFFNNKFPVESTDAKIIKATSLRSKADSNVDILLDPTIGAVGCFKSPNRCKGIKARIDSLLRDITVSDLEFMKDIKYKISIVGRAFGSPTPESLSMCPTCRRIPTPVFYAGDSACALNTLWTTIKRPHSEFRVTAVDITDNYCSFSFNWLQGGYIFPVTYRGYSKDGGREYVGTYTLSIATENANVIKQVSPFFFEPFSVTPSGANNNNN